MLHILIPEQELFLEESNSFHKIKETSLTLEHSLLSLSKWEAKWKKPYLDRKSKTAEELIDYIRCMTINSNVDPYVYYAISEGQLKQISSYMDDSMTATWFSDDKKEKTSNFSSKIITSELIYYWMISLGIPVEKFEKWHLNRLLTLIRVFNAENAPKDKKKRPTNEILAERAALNAKRKAQLHTKG